LIRQAPGQGVDVVGHVDDGVGVAHLVHLLDEASLLRRIPDLGTRFGF
jgi:hypothetical protein